MTKEETLNSMMNQFEELTAIEQKAMLRIFVDMYFEMCESLEDPKKTFSDKQIISANMQNYQMVINLLTKPSLPENEMPSAKRFLIKQGLKLLEEDKKKEIIS